MTQHTITVSIPRTIRVETRRGAFVTVDTPALPESVFSQIFENGIGQKLRDSASSAARLACVDRFGDDEVDGRLTDKQKVWLATPDGVKSAKGHEQALINAALAALLAGDWTQRTASPSFPIETIALVNLFAAALSESKRKAYGELTLADKVAKAEANAKHFTDDAIAGEVAAIERKRAEREAARLEREARKASVADIATKLEIDF